MDKLSYEAEVTVNSRSQSRSYTPEQPGEDEQEADDPHDKESGQNNCRVLWRRVVTHSHEGFVTVEEDFEKILRVDDVHH